MMKRHRVLAAVVAQLVAGLENKVTQLVMRIPDAVVYTSIMGLGPVDAKRPTRARVACRKKAPAFGRRQMRC